MIDAYELLSRPPSLPDHVVSCSSTGEGHYKEKRYLDVSAQCVCFIYGGKPPVSMFLQGEDLYKRQAVGKLGEPRFPQNIRIHWGGLSSWYINSTGAKYELRISNRLGVGYYQNFYMLLNEIVKYRVKQAESVVLYFYGDYI